MKRVMLKESNQVFSVSLQDIPEEIAEYGANLKLLYSVPFSYLIVSEEVLPSESMRFFCIDENWTDALVDGALSVGRNDSKAAALDAGALRPLADCTQGMIRKIRFDKVHKNHRPEAMMNTFAGQEACRSGFIIRSALTKKWKGMEVTGYGKSGLLSMLRSDMIGNDILICIFDGELERVEISEPKIGIRFGAYENDRIIQIKEIVEGENFGKFIPDESVMLHVESNGKLNVIKTIESMKDVLKQEITPSVFAFELMLAAQKAVFYGNCQ